MRVFSPLPSLKQLFGIKAILLYLVTGVLTLILLTGVYFFRFTDYWAHPAYKYYCRTKTTVQVILGWSESLGESRGVGRRLLEGGHRGLGKRILRKAVRAGDMDSAWILADSLRRDVAGPGGVFTEELIDLLRKLGQNGPRPSEAKWELANYLVAGTSNPTDVEEGKKLLRELAVNGEQRAATMLFTSVLDGDECARYLRARVEEGDRLAAGALFERIDRGQVAEASAGEGKALLQRIAADKDQAYTLIARLLGAEVGTPEWDQDARILIEGVEQKFPSPNFKRALGFLWAVGLGGPRFPSQARELLRPDSPDAKIKDGFGASGVGLLQDILLYQFAGDPVDLSPWLPVFSCLEMECPTRETELSMLIERVVKNQGLGEFYRAFNMSHNRGESDPMCGDLGDVTKALINVDMFRFGWGIRRDPTTAFKLIENISHNSEAAGDAFSIRIRLGQAFEKGQGVSQNLERARQEYRKAVLSILADTRGI